MHPAPTSAQPSATVLPTGPPDGTPSTGSSTASVEIPADGVTLAQLGFTYGPRTTFSVPRGSRFDTVVDQSNVVTLVFRSPVPSKVAQYFTAALPAAGFRVDDASWGAATPSFTFRGQGWTGSFTGAGQTAAVTLRPGG